MLDVTINRNSCVQILLFVAVLVVGCELRAAEYYVRHDGDDSAVGTSLPAAWRSISKVNEINLQPGDKVLFEAGETFSGNLSLTAEDTGTADAPVIVGSIGKGRATILAGKDNGITVESAGNVRIENLKIKGAGTSENVGHGILCDNRLTDAPRLRNLVIKNIDVSGFGIFGILISGVTAGFELVRVTDCALHDNLRGGMEIAGRLPWDSPLYAHADVVVRGCRAYKNPGDPDFVRNHSGSGIVLYQVDGGSIERCTAWNNGALGHNRAGGGVGLWVCASRRVVIQECESYANKTKGKDGGGFDIDGGCIECVLQYNYSHDNDGPGLMVYTYPYASHRDHGNIVRFNVSENDSRRSRSYAGLFVVADGRPMSGLQIYNNTVIMGNWSDQAAYVDGEGIEASFRNNIFIARDQAIPLKVLEPRPTLRFEGNLYWRDGGPFSIQWGPLTFTEFDKWREQTTQETISSKASGLFANPLLSDHAESVKPFQFVGLRELLAFCPMPDSALTATGLDIRSTYQIDVGIRDLLGQPLPPVNTYLGAILHGKH